MRAVGMPPRRLAGRAATMSQRAPAAQRRSFQFASSAYHGCFGELPSATREQLTGQTLSFLDGFDAKTWHADPVTTIIDGEAVAGGKEVDTIDAFNRVNGKQVLATSDTVDRIIAHAKNFNGGKDYRKAARAAEAVFESALAGEIIGNQMLDFGKQDGVTEIEESVQANCVERRLNDLLVEEESAGRIAVKRDAAFVGCVSNFSNFLDLFRKAIRNIELGVPVIVLSRSNTTQHMYRWTQLLVKLLKENGAPPGLVTYASADRGSKQRIMAALGDSPMYFTCSRAVAAGLIQHSPHLMSSTEGPNTLVADKWTPEVAAATRLSNLIENKGQCTALRHAVIPGATTDTVKGMYDDVKIVGSAEESLRAGEFANIISAAPTSAGQPPAGYTTHPKAPIAFKVNGSLPGDDLEECWREAYIDVTSPPEGLTDSFVKDLCKWLNHHQPISCALNVPPDTAMHIFDRTGLVVNTLGYPDSPAYTCQARPQDGECFGEFPPRKVLREYTKFPVHIPSATPGYHATYTDEYLKKAAATKLPASVQWAAGIVALADTERGQGYLNVLLEYIADATKESPKRGKTGPRTALYGLQRPPLDAGHTIVRIGRSTGLDTALASALPLYATNARESLVVSVDPQHPKSAKLKEEFKSNCVLEDDAAFAGRAVNAYNVVHAEGSTPHIEPTPFPMAAQWVSLFCPLGHVKSVKQNDEAFVAKFRTAKKWLQLASA